MFWLITLLLGLSALLGSGVLWRHQRVLTYLAAAGALFEGQWLLLTLIDRTVGLHLLTAHVFLVGSLLLSALWGCFYHRWKFPYVLEGSGRRDLFILLPLLVTLVAAWSVARVNGFQESGEWVSHSFYNGDVATFAALTQGSFYTSGLVETNPFAGGGRLEYPTLLHAGMATFWGLSGVGTDWLHFLPLMTYVQIFITVPLFFLLFDVVYPEPDKPWIQWWGVPSRSAVLALQTGVIGYVMAISWDGFIYPQSHFFLTAPLLLLGSILVTLFRQKGSAQVAWMFSALVLTIILLFSNAVMGTVAVAAMSIRALVRANDRSQSVTERGLNLFMVVVLVGLFFYASPGDASFGRLGFSYTAAVDMLRLSPLVILLMVSALLQLKQHPNHSSVTIGIAALAFITFFFSSRNIVVENASRFFYHAAWLGLPLLLGSLLQLYYWIKRELLYTSHPLVERFFGWSGVAVLLFLALLPAGASVASAHDHLWFKDEQRVEPAVRQALAWVASETAPHSIFLANPQGPWNIPVFTGRALLRADYWLSPNDELLSTIQAAFAGEREAQIKVLSSADYLWLNSNEQAAWGGLPLAKVFENEAVVIYRIE